MPSATAPHQNAEPRLRRDAVGLTGAVIMSAAIMGPAVSTFFNPQFSFPFSGEATPFVYLACLIAILIASSGVVAMARELPSAGAFYTYVTRGIGPRAGFVTGGLMFVAYALLPPAEVGLIGSYAEHVPRRVRHQHPVVADRDGPGGPDGPARIRGDPLLAAHGAGPVHDRGRDRAALALIIVGKGGEDGLSLHPLNPAASPNGFSGLTTGFVFAALSFVGFEAAATLGDESRAPRRYVPRAVLLSVLAVGGLYVFCVWAEVIGLGAATVNAMDGSATPWNDLAATYASWMKWPVIIASGSSMFAVMINSANGIVRILNTMGREGLLPKSLAYIDPKRHSPSHAVFATGVFTVVTALTVGAVSGGLGDPAGGSNVYGYLGFLLTLGILPVYVLTNLAAARYFATADGSMRSATASSRSAARR